MGKKAPSVLGGKQEIIHSERSENLGPFPASRNGRGFSVSFASGREDSGESEEISSPSVEDV